MTAAVDRGATPSSSGVALEFVLLGALWGSSFLFMRLGLEDFGVLPIAGGRVTIAALFLLPLLCLRREAAVLRQHWKPVFLIGILNSAIPFLCFAFALQAISTGLSAILNATVPLFGAVVAWLWLREKPNGFRVLGLAIGFAGVALLAWDKASLLPGASGIAPAWAVLACLVATLCYGVAACASKRYLSGMPSMVTATGSQMGAALALALPTAWTWPARMPGLQAWLALIALGVVCTGIAYVLYFRLIERAGPSRTVAVTYIIPVFAVIYGVVLLGETVTAWMVLCGFIIALGTALSAGLIKPPAKPTAP